jgi:hypothetical protein
MQLPLINQRIPWPLHQIWLYHLTWVSDAGPNDCRGNPPNRAFHAGTVAAASPAAPPGEALAHASAPDRSANRLWLRLRDFGRYLTAAKPLNPSLAAWPLAASFTSGSRLRVVASPALGRARIAGELRLDP